MLVWECQDGQGGQGVQSRAVKVTGEGMQSCPCKCADRRSSDTHASERQGGQGGQGGHARVASWPRTVLCVYRRHSDLHVWECQDQGPDPKVAKVTTEGHARLARYVRRRYFNTPICTFRNARTVR